jgi:hypothetical protein
MVSAMKLTCAELTGSDNVAIAASNASFMIPMVSGGKLAFEKSFIELVPNLMGYQLARPNKGSPACYTIREQSKDFNIWVFAKADAPKFTGPCPTSDPG